MLTGMCPRFLYKVYIFGLLGLRALGISIGAPCRPSTVQYGWDDIAVP